ncbi:hypothetical protein [Alysiella crassa]|nr:hypothetical protein [Alysiella crassa]
MLGKLLIVGWAAWYAAQRVFNAMILSPIFLFSGCLKTHHHFG